MNLFKGFPKDIHWKKIAIVVILLIFTYFLYYLFMLSVKSRPIEGLENNGDKSVELILFHVDWCPHCKTAKPVWDQVKSEYNGTTKNGYKIVFTDINCTDETAETDRMMNQYKIEGYPTIKMLKDGQVIEFDAKPSQDSLIKFLNTAI